MTNHDSEPNKITRKQLRIQNEENITRTEIKKLRDGLNKQAAAEHDAVKGSAPKTPQNGLDNNSQIIFVGPKHKADSSKWFGRLITWVTITKHSLRSMSLLRILYGLAMVWLLTTSYADRHYMWGEASTWIDPAVSLRNYPELFDVFPKNNPALFDFFFIVLIALAVMFTVGLFTKAVTPVLLIMWVGLSTNSVLLTNGGDVVMRITLLFLVFANLNEHYSLDNLIRKRFTGGKPYLRDFIKVNPIVGNTAHNTALLLAAYQVILVYVNSGILKLMGSEWRDGTALYYALTLDVFMPFPGLSEFFRTITPFIFVGSIVSIWAQLFFPLLLIWRPTRYFAVVVLTTMHFGIALLLGLWPFSMAMIGLDLLFVNDDGWEAIRSRIKSIVTFRVTTGRVSRNSRI